MRKYANDTAGGRPLKVNGREIEPDLELGEKWSTRNFHIDQNVDPESRSAIEALWLRDAKKEFASVPAFSKLGWQLAGFGAGPELLQKVFLAGLQEIKHSQLCFSMASAFGQKRWGGAKISEINALNLKSTSLSQLAVECFVDGCVMESFNADVASESLKIVEDQATQKVLSVIAKDETFHGELSWDILRFLISQGGPDLVRLLTDELKKIEIIPAPRAYPKEIENVVEQGDLNWLIYYGRLPKEEFPALWQARLKKTRELLKASLSYSKSKTPQLEVGDASH